MKKVSFLFLVAIICFIAGRHTVCGDTTNRMYYVVQKGDSINRIADRHRVLSWQLRKANNMEVEDVLLHPGQKLVIPVIKWKSYSGRASWYGPGFHGKKMANGQVYDQNKVLIAHRTLPLGLKVRITNLENSKSIIAEVLDRGPYTKKDGRYDREVDLSLGAAKILEAVKKGIIPVKITPLS
ncbi:MAG: septal ring lytic transglycosylase RlpA family protein [Patescibacteria group bacterium]|nr:septal ring lytic transglycosylase RlpA family protein [Patescibacteria group bacterium]